MRTTPWFALLLILAVASLAAADWQTAVIVTDDKVHEKNGGAEIDGNDMVIRAGGNDIWGNADQFTYVYQEISGDFEMSITVHSLVKTNDWAKAGVMARQSLEPESKNVLAAVRGLGDLVTFQYRPTDGTSSQSERLTASKGSIPVSIKLIRNGDEFTGTYTPDYNGEGSWVPEKDLDGKNGGPPAPWVLPMDDPILLGVAVTSHETGVITTAEVTIINAPFNLAVDASGKLAATWGRLKQ